MQLGSLIKHEQYGIGQVLKVLTKAVKAKFGLNNEYIVTIQPKDLVELDTNGVKRMTYFEATKYTDDIIVGNLIKNYVGIGWITIRIVNENDLLKFPAFDKSLPSVE